jgi:hypothetical protein
MNKILETLESDMGDSDGQIDQIMRPLLLQAGISWEDEYASLRALYNATTVGGASSEAVDVAETDAFGVWLLRILLSTTLTSYLVSSLCKPVILGLIGSGSSYRRSWIMVLSLMMLMRSSASISTTIISRYK